MITIQAILDTIEYISERYDDKHYFVRKEVFDVISFSSFGSKWAKWNDNGGDNDNNIYYEINNKLFMLSENHPYDSSSIKIYNDDSYPFYIKILTKDERTIQEIIE